MSKKSASKRNRHTGRINAGKKHLLDKGHPVKIGETQYMSSGTVVTKHPVFGVDIPLHTGTYVKTPEGFEVPEEREAV